MATRYVKVFDSDGNLIAEEPYEVSDEELYWEQIEKQANDASHRLKEAWDNWDTLSGKQKLAAAEDLIPCVLALLRNRF